MDVNEAENLIAANAILGYPEVPKVVRRQLTRNAVHCRTCNTTIESRHRHDWVACGCPQNSDKGIYVDGGLAYSRRGIGKDADYFDLCEYDDTK